MWDLPGAEPIPSKGTALQHRDPFETLIQLLLQEPASRSAQDSTRADMRITPKGDSPFPLRPFHAGSRFGRHPDVSPTQPDSMSTPGRICGLSVRRISCRPRPVRAASAQEIIVNIPLKERPRLHNRSFYTSSIQSGLSTLSRVQMMTKTLISISQGTLRPYLRDCNSVSVALIKLARPKRF